MFTSIKTIILGLLVAKILSEKSETSTYHYNVVDNQKIMSGTNRNEEGTLRKIDFLGETFKKSINRLKVTGNLDILFLIDASSSVGERNFKSELKFVKKVLSDITVDSSHTRVAIVTFSSPSNTVKNVDEISKFSENHSKCILLNKQLNKINYSGGETFTIGAFQTAKEIFDHTFRNNSKKVLFLITDGYSSGGDPIPLANELKSKDITIFTIGVQSGNYDELHALSSAPGESYSYLLDSFKEFEALARRALHADLKNGDYIPVGKTQPCDILCKEGDCCDTNAVCTCGTTTGHYMCICKSGYYGSGLKNSCLPCAPGTYSQGPNKCLPCPDVHHTTVWPAYGSNSCKCKEGYRTIKNNECKVLKCPRIALPKRGYFVKKNECNNVFNSACGIRCEVGYTLVGNSIRLCQINGTWSGSEPTCEVKTCPSLNVPKFGKIKCKHADLNVEYRADVKKLPVDTVCIFQCEKGKLLIGSRKRTCLPLSTWDGLKTTCKALKCNKLAQIKFGKIEPRSCNLEKQEFGRTCKITCNDGFQISGPKEKKCIGKHGGWDSKFEETSCIDAIPPTLFCPDNITINALPGKNYGQAIWKPPVATDNSGLAVLVWIQPAINNASNLKFRIGETPITYFAQDVFHNKASCTFFVVVRDNEVPVIENCVDPPPFLTNDLNGANVTWEEPYVYDNSQKVKVSKSHEFGFFKIGTTTVTYTAIDGSSNKNICKINITLEETQCEFLPPTPFSQTTCNNQGQCIVTCKEGYAIHLEETEGATGNASSFICNNLDPMWLEEEPLFPECSVTTFPEETVQDGEISVSQENNTCDNTTIFEALKQDIESVLTNEICIQNCTVDTKSQCETENSEDNKIRIRRQNTAFEEVAHRNKNRKYRKKINVKFQVRGKYLNETGAELKNIKLRAGYNITIRYNKKRFICPVGFVPRKNRCVQCPKGTFHNNSTNKCQSCDFGYYNDKLGQTQCCQCPLHYSTKKLHSKKASQCKEECPPGTHAQKRYVRYSGHHPVVKIERATLKPNCKICPIGFYQEDYGQLKCVPCPTGFTTTNAGARTLTECMPSALHICKTNANICNNGTCLAMSAYEYTCSCFENFIGTNCEKEINDCISEPCLNNGTCNYFNGTYTCSCKEGFNGKFCEEDAVKCNMNCLNNGTCLEVDTNEFICLCRKDYGGDRCENKIRYCTEDICENNGTCVEDEGTFKCQCLSGFIGRRCNILPCDYKPCGEFAICINVARENATKEDYRCVCPEGFTGSECNIKLNPCQSLPCLNGGTCHNNISTYFCNCTNFYHGFNCQYKWNSNYLLNFQRYDTNDFVKLNGFGDNLTEITACLWMQTSDSFNYGTLISYASRDTDNAFTLMDYTGLVLYINNENMVTDVVLNDGYWHHVCTSWQSKEGFFEIYVDGNIIKNGTGLSRDKGIQGDGVMILGQEQDKLGEEFSLSESYSGKMAYVDIWSKRLQLKEILIHFNDCNDSIFGDLYAWPEMQSFVHGGVQILETPFCTKCEEPKPPYNGNVKVIDNVAYYSCHTGYVLNNDKDSKGRKCTKAARWEGFYEPYCKKIYCGYPGFVKNGYQIGNSYYYLDKIVFNCYEGFNMTGNSVIVCEKDGVWIPSKPECLGTQCRAFRKPNKSELNIYSDFSYKDYLENKTEFEAGTQIEIVCDSDTELLGENILTCTDTGTWNYNPPECKEKFHNVSKSGAIYCSVNLLPSPPVNGYIDLKSLYAAGNGTANFVEYKCRPGYTLIGDNVTTCIVDGYWTQPNTSCWMIVCKPPLLLPNMVPKEESMVKDVYAVGTSLSLQCTEGYNIFRSNVIRCMLNGRWSKIQGKCVRKSCRKPNVVGGGTIQGRSFLYNDTVTVVCPNGASYQITCNKFGVWEGETENACL